MTDNSTPERDQDVILIVDDSQESLEILNRILEEEGYRVRLATSGRLALKSVAVKLPDLILLDVRMPEMDGYEVCRSIKSNEKSRNVPVIFISAHGETDKKIRGFKAGGVDFIEKPFEREEILVRVESQLRLRKLNEDLEREVERRTGELVLANQQLSEQMARCQQAEKELSREVEVNLAAAELSQKLISPAPINSISSLVLEHAKNLTGSPLGFTGYIDPETGYLVSPTLTRNIWDACRVEEKNFIFKEFKGLWGWVLNNRISLMTNRVSSDSRSTGTPEGHVPVFRFLSAPALINGTLVGLVSVANAESDYTERDIQVIERLANLYAIAIQRQQAEEELKKHRNRLEELVTERTAELESFAYSVSHDLRAPLRHIDGFLEILKSRIEGSLDKETGKYFSNVTSAAHKMGELIDDLLSFSRMGREEIIFKKIPFGDIVRLVIQELKSDTKDRKVQWEIGELPEVNCDASMMRVLVMNLISNALKFTRPRKEAVIEISSLIKKDEVIISIRDNGVGFDQAYSDRLFGVFQRLHRSDEFEGTGVGLAIAQRIIQRHRGRIWGEGKIDKGATFYFSLPLVVEKLSTTAND